METRHIGCVQHGEIGKDGRETKEEDIQNSGNPAWV